MAPKQFKGEGFSTEPFTPEESAQIREMFKELDANFVELSGATYDYMTSISTLIAAWVIGVRVVKFGAPGAVILAAIGYYAKQAGLF